MSKGKKDSRLANEQTGAMAEDPTCGPPDNGSLLIVLLDGDGHSVHPRLQPA
jgi:hypothetical protein